MRVLALETATGRLGVAVLDDDQVLALAERDAPGQHARHVIPLIDEVMRSANVTLGALDGIAVSIGPGSFTGLRVGLATALGFRLTAGLPIACVPTLEALAWQARGTAAWLMPMLKARPGELYWARYESRDGELRKVESERVGLVAQVVAMMPPGYVAVGDGWDGCAPLLPSAISVGELGIGRLRDGQIAGADVSPYYVQRAEAEIRWDARAAVSGPGR